MASAPDIAIHFATPIVLTFGFLALSICCVWLAPIEVSPNRYMPLWPLPFGAAIVCGLLGGILNFVAIIGLGALIMAAILATRTGVDRAGRFVFTTLAAVIAVALALHQLPGFNNPILIANVKFSHDAATFTQFANFDKAAAGLIILAFFCARAKTAAQWKQVLRCTYPVVIITSATVITVTLITGQIRPDLKLSAYTPVFLATNLLFTCVAEEAFFRGLLQDRLAKSLQAKRLPLSNMIAVVCSALLFGLVHAAGGPWYVMVSGLAGLGYGYAYAVVQRVEAPVLVHFLLNATHFVGFTYPRLG